MMEQFSIFSIVAWQHGAAGMSAAAMATLATGIRDGEETAGALHVREL